MILRTVSESSTTITVGSLPMAASSSLRTGLLGTGVAKSATGERLLSRYRATQPKKDYRRRPRRRA